MNTKEIYLAGNAPTRLNLVRGIYHAEFAKSRKKNAKIWKDSTRKNSKRG